MTAIKKYSEYWTVTLNGVKQKGVFTREEIGEKISALLFMMGGPHNIILDNATDEEVGGWFGKEASTRKMKKSDEIYECYGCGWETYGSSRPSKCPKCGSDEWRCIGYTAGDVEYIRGEGYERGRGVRNSTRKSFNSMVKSQRTKNRVAKSDRYGVAYNNILHGGVDIFVFDQSHRAYSMEAKISATLDMCSMRSEDEAYATQVALMNEVSEAADDFIEGVRLDGNVYDGIEIVNYGHLRDI